MYHTNWESLGKKQLRSEKIGKQEAAAEKVTAERKKEREAGALRNRSFGEVKWDNQKNKDVSLIFRWKQHVPTCEKFKKEQNVFLAERRRKWERGRLKGGGGGALFSRGGNQAANDAGPAKDEAGWIVHLRKKQDIETRSRQKTALPRGDKNSKDTQGIPGFLETVSGIGGKIPFRQADIKKQGVRRVGCRGQR